MAHPELQSALRAYLFPAERVLWAGRPRQGIRLQRADLYLVPFSLAWAGFVLFWFWTASTQGAPPFFLAFGSIMLIAGFDVVFGRFLRDAWFRRRLIYAVTDRRLIILRTGPFGHVRSLELRHLPVLELDERASGGTISFDGGPANGFFPLGFRPEWAPAASKTPRFFDIEEARSVYDLISRECERIARVAAAEALTDPFRPQ
jgi:hypothetical protein